MLETLKGFTKLDSDRFNWDCFRHGRCLIYVDKEENWEGFLEQCSLHGFEIDEEDHYRSYSESNKFVEVLTETLLNTCLLNDSLEHRVHPDNRMFYVWEEIINAKQRQNK